MSWAEGALDGSSLGDFDGPTEGAALGPLVGEPEGTWLGEELGLVDEDNDGPAESSELGGELRVDDG